MVWFQGFCHWLLWCLWSVHHSDNSTTHSQPLIYFSFWPCGLWDLSSLTRDQTQAVSSENTPGGPGIPQPLFFKVVNWFSNWQSWNTKSRDESIVSVLTSLNLITRLQLYEKTSPFLGNTLKYLGVKGRVVCTHVSWMIQENTRQIWERDRRESNDIGNEIKCQPDANLDKEPPNGSYLLYFIIYIFIIYILYIYML